MWGHRMQSPRDLLETLANAIRGNPIGDVHLHIIHHYFARDDLTPAERKSSENRVRKLLRSMALRKDLQLLLRRLEEKAKTAQVSSWPAPLLAEFATELETGIDFTELFDDVPLFVVSARSVLGERNAKRLVMRYGCKTWCLQLTTVGTAGAAGSNGVIALNRGDIVLIPPETPFHIERGDDAPSWHYYMLYFLPRSHTLNWFEWGRTREGLLIGRITESELPRWEQVFEELIRLRDTQSPIRRELEFNLMEQLLLRCRGAINLPNQNIDERVALAKAYIAQHHAQPIQLGDIATAVGLSASRLSVLFHEHVGMTLTDWRNRHRIALAAQWLRESDLPLKEIAKKIGYPDALYFSRVFRRYMGVAPSSLRMNHSGESSGYPVTVQRRPNRVSKRAKTAGVKK